jgi:hypothetical protein
VRYLYRVWHHKCGVKLLAELVAGLFWLTSILNSSSIMHLSERSRFSELATGWTAEETCPDFGTDYKLFLCQAYSDRLQGPCHFLFSWYQLFYPGLKRSESKSNHLAPSITKTKNAWSSTFISLHLISWRVT